VRKEGHGVIEQHDSSQRVEDKVTLKESSAISFKEGSGDRVPDLHHVLAVRRHVNPHQLCRTTLWMLPYNFLSVTGMGRHDAVQRRSPSLSRRMAGAQHQRKLHCAGSNLASQLLRRHMQE
jgi:hypothetical protein